jgi:hypothetical protein
MMINFMQDYAGGENRSCKQPQMLQAVRGASEFVQSTSDQVVKVMQYGETKADGLKGVNTASVWFFKLFTLFQKHLLIDGPCASGRQP